MPPDPIDFRAKRARPVNDRPVNPDGKYVLYWCQMYRRLRHNHALDHARRLAMDLNKPLVIYEGLKLNYPWASARFHAFILDGMRDSYEDARKLGATYWPFVETPENNGHGLVRALCQSACALITDDYPQYIVPAHNRAIGAKARVAVVAVDGNGVVPLSLLGPPTAAAAHLRPKIHKLFLGAWAARADAEPDFSVLPKYKGKPPFATWTPPKTIADLVATLPIDQSVTVVRDVPGGSAAGHACLDGFIKEKMKRYSGERSKPDDPLKNSASRMSPYLHYGHVGIEEVVDRVFKTVDWKPELINPKTRNKDDFYCRDPDVNSYLDEAVTWRDVGYQWHYARMRAAEDKTPAEHAKSWEDAGEAMPSFNYETFDFGPLPKSGTLAAALPEWARATLAKHARDPRAHTYTVDEFESASTHDELWNAAQKEIVATGRVHNYMRMLWGKKVLEWSRTPEEGYRILEHLNNKYALDGRDPNSYCGILWTFGLFDRPWPPERDVFGVVRYMTSQSTAKKFKMAGYLDYVRRVSGGAVPAGSTPALPFGE